MRCRSEVVRTVVPPLRQSLPLEFAGHGGRRRNPRPKWAEVRLGCVRIIARRTLREFVHALAGYEDQFAGKNARGAWFHQVQAATGPTRPAGNAGIRRQASSRPIRLSSISRVTRTAWKFLSISRRELFGSNGSARTRPTRKLCERGRVWPLI